jgi:hypothetical protein
MEVVAIIGPSDVEGALAKASEVGGAREIAGLAAPLGGALMGRLSEAWEAVRDAIQESFRRGADAARSLVDSAAEKAERIIDEAGARAADLREALTARLQQYLTALIDRALAKVRGTVAVGGTTLNLSGVEIGQTIKLTGSLKVSIHEICSVTSEGELSVTARYGVA